MEPSVFLLQALGASQQGVGIESWPVAPWAVRQADREALRALREVARAR